MEIPERVEKLEKSPTPALTEAFGPLQGIRILCTGSLVAVPHGATIMADLGAEVIHIENPGTGDPSRISFPRIHSNDGKTEISSGWANNARNQLSMELDMRINKNPLSREVFLGLIKSCDIWIENMVWLEKRYGITDNIVLKTNPRMVIVHESGYGKPEFGGQSNKCWRAAYDIIGQAYGGLSYITGEPDGPPTRVEPYSADYITAIFVALGALMGYIHSRKTGRGQVVDVAQFEAVARILGGVFPDYLNSGHITGRSGNKSNSLQPYGLFQTKDGYIALGAFDNTILPRFLQALAEATGINIADYPTEKHNLPTKNIHSPQGLTLDKLLEGWVSSHTTAKVCTLFNKYQIPCSPVYNSADAAQDYHWKARENFMQCIDQTTQRKINIFGITPKISETPGKIWRGAPAQGQDTDNILNKILGYSAAEIQYLRDEKIVCR